MSQFSKDRYLLGEVPLGTRDLLSGTHRRSAEARRTGRQPRDACPCAEFASCYSVPRSRSARGTYRAALHIEDKSFEVVFTFGFSKIQVIWALVPAEGFAMCVGQNGTREKGDFICPGSFGTGVRCSVVASASNSCAKGPGCHKMSRIVTPKKGVWCGRVFKIVFHCNARMISATKWLCAQCNEMKYGPTGPLCLPVPRSPASLSVGEGLS